MKPKTPAFKNIFWAVTTLTLLSFVILFNIVGPHAAPVSVIIFSVTSIIGALASIFVVAKYIRNYKPARVAVTAGVVVTIGLLFGIFLCVWYLVYMLHR